MEFLIGLWYDIFDGEIKRWVLLKAFMLLLILVGTVQFLLSVAGQQWWCDMSTCGHCARRRPDRILAIGVAGLQI